MTSDDKAGRASSAPGLFLETISAFGGIVVLLLMVLIGADILGRTLFNAPVRGVAEIASLAIVAVVFLQLPQAIRSGRMLRSDGLLLALSSRPRMVAPLQLLNDILLFLLMVVLLWFGTGPFRQSWQTDEYIGALGDFTAPLWPVRLAILIGCALGALYALVMAARHLRLLTYRSDGK
ncbi:TRAP transporter small permease subunit [Mesobacterium pallidum]|uniref:TRAP transporter small permease subunit n=1 Tax=Mesobacterium pallidum TaxID=2872037 RepID=UPI001EE1DC20|nr:TRAP transporter small permease [Mesobacterium pallidum]